MRRLFILIWYDVIVKALCVGFDCSIHLLCTSPAMKTIECNPSTCNFTCIGKELGKTDISLWQPMQALGLSLKVRYLRKIWWVGKMAGVRYWSGSVTYFHF
jgi:hypothetical protein